MHLVRPVSGSGPGVVLQDHSHRAMDEQVGANDLWPRECHDLVNRGYLEEKGGELHIQ